jgi:peptide-methionine (R)-S-oxide reductase
MAMLRRTAKSSRLDAEWRQPLNEEEYRVTRRVGSERAFSSDLCSLFEARIYSCLGCAAILFDASGKYESGTGWSLSTLSQIVTPQANI